jgi:hypothetical protein
MPFDLADDILSMVHAFPDHERREMVRDVAARTRAIIAENARLREILRAVEWMGPGARTKAENGPLKGDRCPYCHHVREIGHSAACKIGVLSATRRPCSYLKAIHGPACVLLEGHSGPHGYRLDAGQRLANLYSALADSVESMSDEELLAEAAERGVDPAAERDKIVAMLHEVLDKYDPAPAPTHASPTIEKLIDRSSLGTPEAKAFRAQADPAHVARVLARVDELDQHDHDEEEDDDFQADQCGAVGDPRDPKMQVCVLEPGHDGPHRAIHVGTVEIVEWCVCKHKRSEHDKNGCFGSDQERSFGPRVHCKCSEFKHSCFDAAAVRCVNGFTREQHLAFDSYCRCDYFETEKKT